MGENIFLKMNRAEEDKKTNKIGDWKQYTKKDEIEWNKDQGKLRK